MPKLNKAPKRTKRATRSVKWSDVFLDPDLVGSSEYRALHELMADVAEVPNWFGDLTDRTCEITPKAKGDMLSAIDELIEHAASARLQLLQTFGRKGTNE
jgi:hypothetical protein